MYKMNEDLDQRGAKCAYKLITTDLQYGCGSAINVSTVSHNDNSSSFVSSHNLSEK